MSKSRYFFYFCTLLLFVQISLGQLVKTNPMEALSSEILDLAAGNDVWVAVGQRGLIATYDGDSWQELLPLTSDHLNSVAYTGSRFIAVGDRGLILASNGTDTSTWSIIQSNTTDPLYKIQQLNGEWIILGYRGQLLRSENGETWETLHPKSDYSKHFECLTYFNGEYIAMEDHSLWRSPDGANWTEDPSETYVTYPIGIKVLNGRLVAWGYHHGIAESHDGQTWTELDSPLPMQWDAITDLIYADGQYFLTGSDRFLDELRSVYISTDLASWVPTDGRGRLTIAADGSTFITDAVNTVETSPNGINWKRENDFLAYATIFRDGYFIGISRNYLYSSPDGLNWATTQLPNEVSGER